MQQGAVFAQVLAHNAVHAAFAGFTGVTVRTTPFWARSTCMLETLAHCSVHCCWLLNRCGKGLWEVPFHWRIWSIEVVQSTLLGCQSAWPWVGCWSLAMRGRSNSMQLFTLTLIKRSDHPAQVGLVNTHYVYLPIPTVIMAPRRVRCTCLKAVYQSSV